MRINETHRRVRVVGRGFSLVELAVVMVLVTLLAAVAVPALSGAAEARTLAGVAHVERDVAGARDLASHGGVRTWIRFSVAQQRYEAFVEQAENPGIANRLARIDPMRGGAFIQDFGGAEWGGLALTSASFDGGSELGFDWKGLPLAVSGSPLAFDGVLEFSNGRHVVVSANSGLASGQE